MMSALAWVSQIAQETAHVVFALCLGVYQLAGT